MQMTLDHPDLSSAFDWLCLVGNVLQPIRFTSQIRVVNVISMEFPRSFPRRLLVGDQWWLPEMSAVFLG